MVYIRRMALLWVLLIFGLHGGIIVIGRIDRWQEELFVAAPLSSLIPEDHILKRVDRILNLSWLHNEVADTYCEINGRPSINPEAALRLMLAGFFQGIVHDRKLMREAQVNLAIRWFAGFRLDEKLPNHSSLTRIRQRWGAKRFYAIFQKTVQVCVEANLVSGETVHVDATLIRANVSWDSISEKHAEQVMMENPIEDDAAISKPEKPLKSQKVSRTDPEASLATSSRNQKMEPSYKQHTAVDDLNGVVVDVIVTTGSRNEGEVIPEQVQHIEANTGKKIQVLTADAGYAYGKVFALLEEHSIDAIIPTKSSPQSTEVMSSDRFKYDGKHKIVRCPRGRILKRSTQTKYGWHYRSSVRDCRHCPLRHRCLSPKVERRTIVISHHHEALLRARRRRTHWDDRMYRMYNRHRWRSEGAHSEAKLQHGLRRAIRWGLDNMAIQAYLTAAVMNLKRLTALWPFLMAYLHKLLGLISRCRVIYAGQSFLCQHYVKIGAPRTVAA
jgi:transposase